MTASMMWLPALCLLLLPGFIQCIPIDNAEVTPPQIVCHPDSIEITIETRNNFEGHFYVKNKFDNPACKYSASDASPQTQANIRLPFGDECTVNRRRSANPKGIFADVTVVLSFHPVFLTKVDKAYTIQCFYMEADKTVSTDIEVSMITTGFQTQFVPMPICRYEVLDSPDGSPVKFALIGQSVFHKWTCDTETVDTFCMKVYGCFVNDFGADQFQLLDDEGCAQDRFIMNNIEYSSDLMAFVEAHVFKYADRPALYFECQIQIDVKEPNGDCAEQTQPDCPEPGGAGAPGARLQQRTNRQRNNRNNRNNRSRQRSFRRGRGKRSLAQMAGVVDVSTSFTPLEMADAPDGALLVTPFDQSQFVPVRQQHPSDVIMTSSCVSPMALSVVSFSILSFVGTLFSIVYCRRR